MTFIATFLPGVEAADGAGDFGGVAFGGGDFTGILDAAGLPTAGLGNSFAAALGFGGLVGLGDFGEVEDAGGAGGSGGFFFLAGVAVAACRILACRFFMNSK